MSEGPQFEVHDSTKFGWCVDGVHVGCRVRFSYYEKDYRCACDCHPKDFLPPLVPGKNMHPTTPDKSERAPRKKK